MSKCETKTEQRLNFDLPIDIHHEFEELHLIEKRKSGKLLKRDLLVEVIKRGIRHWNNK